MKNISRFIAISVATIMFVAAVTIAFSQYKNFKLLLDADIAINDNKEVVAEKKDIFTYKGGDKIYGFQLINIIKADKQLLLEGINEASISKYDIYEIEKAEHYNDGILIRKIKIK